MQALQIGAMNSMLSPNARSEERLKYKVYIEPVLIKYGSIKDLTRQERFWRGHTHHSPGTCYSPAPFGGSHGSSPSCP